LDYTSKSKIEIKYYAADEIFGFIGGNLQIVLMITGWLLNPYSKVRFVSKNSLKKE